MKEAVKIRHFRNKKREIYERELGTNSKVEHNVVYIEYTNVSVQNTTVYFI